MLSRKSRKGQIEISFNWIFILLAGGAILLFFTFVIIKSTNSSQQENQAALTKKMDSLLASIETNPSTIKDVGYIATRLSFSCNAEIHEFYAESSSVRSQLESELIYSPEQIGNSHIIAWTIPLNAPYKVSNILLLSDEKTLYVFSNNVKEDLILKFPTQFSKTIKANEQIDSISDTGYEKYVVVIPQSVNTDSLSFAPSLRKKGKLTVVKIPDKGEIVMQPRNATKGVVEYYEYENGEVSNSKLKKIGESSFVTLPLLYGAIISANPSLYNCSTSKVLKRIRSADNLNKIRLEDLRGKYVSDPSSYCSVLYLKAINSITSKISALDNFYQASGRENFSQNYNDLVTTNDQLLVSNCPTIFG